VWLMKDTKLCRFDDDTVKMRAKLKRITRTVDLQLHCYLAQRFKQPLGGAHEHHPPPPRQNSFSSR
jgi:hypothetical protein